MLAPPYSKTPHIDHGPQSLCTPAKEVTTKISFLYDTVLLPGTSCQTKVSAYNQNFICYQSKVFFLTARVTSKKILLSHFCYRI